WSGNVRIIGFFEPNRRFWTMTWIYRHLVRQTVQLAADGIIQVGLPASRQIRAAYAHAKQHISGEKVVSAQEADASRRMTWRMEYSKLMTDQLQILTLGKLILCGITLDGRRYLGPAK